MSAVTSILVPLDGSAATAQCLSVAAWLAARLGAHLHILGVAAHAGPAQEALERLHIDAARRPKITLHQVARLRRQAVLGAAEHAGADLIVLSAHGEAVDTVGGAEPLPPLGHIARRVIEDSAAPVMVLPPSYRERLPWKSALVPVSGEVDADAALALAVRLANALDMKIRVAHVVGAGDGACGLTAEVRYADAPHHEYPSRLQELISRVLPRCSRAECECIEDVTLLRGDAAGELLSLLERGDVGVVVAGWHGRFVAGHAELIKRLVAEISCPILLVKAAPPQPFALKVGAAIE